MGAGLWDNCFRMLLGRGSFAHSSLKYAKPFELFLLE
jgi:hypothetical protein